MHWAEGFGMQLHPTVNIHLLAAKLFAELGADPNQFRYEKNGNLEAVTDQGACWIGYEEDEIQNYNL